MMEPNHNIFAFYFKDFPLHLHGFKKGQELGIDRVLASLFLNCSTHMKIERKHLWHSLVPYHLRAKSAPDYCMFPKVQPESYGPYNTPVYLNVYDLTPVNGFVYWAGVGVFHTGLEIDGVEYAFGAHEFSTSGVFEIEPRQCPGFKFREAIYMGTVHMDPIQVREFIENASANYSGNTYHVITKNCNHFCEDICYKLTGKAIPKWVNRLANIGSLCSCVIPIAHQNSTVRPDPDCQGYDDEKKSLTNSFSCLSSISMPQREREVSISSLFSH